MGEPLTVRVGYATVPVVAIDHVEAEDQNFRGSYSQRKQRIEIKSSETPAEQACILVHELIHACFDVYDLAREKLTEEDVCEALDGPLTMLFTDNPTLIGVIHQAVNHGRPIV